MSGTGQIAVMATDRGVIVEARGEEHTVSVCLTRASVARLVVLLAQADGEHQKLLKGAR